MKKIFEVIGSVLLLLGIVMAMFGASLFTYHGNSLNPVISAIGKYCFIYFLETILAGCLFLFVAWIVKK